MMDPHEMTRRDLIRYAAALPLVHFGPAVDRLPVRRPKYQMNRIHPDEPGAAPHYYQLRLAEIVPEGMPVPRWPRTVCVADRDSGWENFLATIRRNPLGFFAGIDAADIVVMPEAKEPVHYAKFAPFDRYLQCSRCRLCLPLADAYARCGAYGAAGRFYGRRCPVHAPDGGDPFPLGIIDHRQPERPDRVVRLPESELVRVGQDYDAEESYWVWKIPASFRNGVKAGARCYVDRAPIEVLHCVERDMDLAFAPGRLVRVA